MPLSPRMQQILTDIDDHRRDYVAKVAASFMSGFITERSISHQKLREPGIADFYAEAQASGALKQGAEGHGRVLRGDGTLALLDPPDGVPLSKPRGPEPNPHAWHVAGWPIHALGYDLNAGGHPASPAARDLRAAEVKKATGYAVLQAILDFLATLDAETRTGLTDPSEAP